MWALAAAAFVAVIIAWPLLITLIPSSFIARYADVLPYLGATDLMAVPINDSNFAMVERAAHWIAAWRMFSLRPWLGVGLGQYATIYPLVAVPRWTDPLGHAHNYYLNILAEGGLVGLVGYLVFLVAAFVAAWRLCLAQQGLATRGRAGGPWAWLGHLAAHSMVDNLYVHSMYLVVAMLLGMVAAPRRTAVCSDTMRIPPSQPSSPHREQSPRANESAN